MHLVYPNIMENLSKKNGRVDAAITRILRMKIYVGNVIAQNSFGFALHAMRSILCPLIIAKDERKVQGVKSVIKLIRLMKRKIMVSKMKIELKARRTRIKSLAVNM